MHRGAYSVAAVGFTCLVLSSGPSGAFEVESDSEGNTIRLAIDDRIGVDAAVPGIDVGASTNNGALTGTGPLIAAVLSAPEWIEITEVGQSVGQTGAAPGELVIRFDVSSVPDGSHGLLQLQVQAHAPDGDFSRDRAIPLTVVADAPPAQESFSVVECCLTPASVDGALGQNPALVIASPNPSRSLVHFVFALPEPGGRAKLEVFDAAGRLLATRETPSLPGGFHRLTWDGRDAHGVELPPGTYFGRLSSGSWAETAKVQIVR